MSSEGRDTVQINGEENVPAKRTVSFLDVGTIDVSLVSDFPERTIKEMIRASSVNLARPKSGLSTRSASGNAVKVSDTRRSTLESTGKLYDANRNLEIVGLKELEIGKDYECQGKNGDWYPITVTGYDEETKRYQANVHDNTGTKSNQLRSSQCVESAPSESKINWPKYIIWRLIDVTLTAAWIVPVILYHEKFGVISETLPGIEWYWVFLVFPILVLMRLFWLVVWPQQKGAKSVAPCMSKKVAINEKEIYIIGTLHVSPGSVRDVTAVSEEVNPDAYLIELDRERLDAMRDRDKEPKPCTQELKLTDAITTKSVNAEWNGLLHKKNVQATLIFSKDKSAAEQSSIEVDDGVSSLSGKILVVPVPQDKREMYITLRAQKREAAAVLFVDIGKTVEDAPSRLILSTGGFFKQTGTCCKMRSPKLPEIPAYLIPGDVLEKFQKGEQIEINVDSRHVGIPSTANKMWCRALVIYGSGLGILYGIIRLAGVKAGQEFVQADDLAKEKGKPCVTIDMSMDRLGRRICKSLWPTPKNILKYIIAWVSFTRIVLSWFFLPMAHKLDLALNMCMGFGRFKLRTWLAFLLGTICSSLLITGIVLGISYASAESARAASSGKSEEEQAYIANLVFQLVALGINLWFFPAIYYGLLDSRDEQMYRGIVAQVRARPHLKKFVVVIGAAHSNGILRRLRERGI